MNFEGESLLTLGNDQQVQIDALAARVTVLETKMSTAETNITTLQTGVFSTSVKQYTNKFTPYMNASTDVVLTIASQLTDWVGLTPGITPITEAIREGALIYYFTAGALDGSSTELQFALAKNASSILSSGWASLRPGNDQQFHNIVVEAYLSLYSFTSPTACKCKAFIRAMTGQDGSLTGGVTEGVVGTLNFSGLDIDPTDWVNTLQLAIRWGTVSPGFTRTFSFVSVLH